MGAQGWKLFLLPFHPLNPLSQSLPCSQKRSHVLSVLRFQMVLAFHHFDTPDSPRNQSKFKNVPFTVSKKGKHVVHD